MIFINKYKIAVYAICKNESKFIDRWYNSMKEADSIYVLDTGSSDNSVKLLKSHNINVVSKQIKPWRFDVARNISLELIPKDYDICVCVDIDEVFESGWRKELEKLWNKNINRIEYNYNWSLDKNNKPIVNFYISKIHSRNDYKWTHPVHEVLTFLGKEEKIVKTDKITVNHYPDETKSRANYLPLLELSVKECPDDDRNMHYLGREYMFHGMWNKSIDTLIKHLSLPSSLWKDERSASMRFISRCYKNLNRYEEAKMWLEKAIIETPYLRDPYVERAILSYQLNEYKDVIYYCNKSLEIKEHQKTYINEPFSWDYTINDLLSISYFYLNDFDKSYENILKALEYEPDNKRLLNNKKIIEDKINKISK